MFTSTISQISFPMRGATIGALYETRHLIGVWYHQICISWISWLLISILILCQTATINSLVFEIIDAFDKIFCTSLSFSPKTWKSVGHRQMQNYHANHNLIRRLRPLKYRPLYILFVIFLLDFSILGAHLRV